jgi:hypothetical protein
VREVVVWVKVEVEKAASEVVAEERAATAAWPRHLRLVFARRRWWCG